MGLLAEFVKDKYVDPGMFSWQGFFWRIFGGNGTGNEAPKIEEGSGFVNSIDAAWQVVSTIELVLWIIIGVVGLAAVVYAVYLGFQLARASEQGKRDEAKKHLITVIIAIVVTLVLVIFFLYLLPAILGATKGVTF